MTDALPPQPLRSPTGLLVLLGLRLRSVAPAEVVAQRFGLERPEVDAQLVEAAANGWVRHREGVLAGWSLTTDGRSETERRLGAELARTGAREGVERAYSGFLELNGELLAICTDWQVITVGGVEVVNDHGDADRDARVIARLGSLHRRIQPVLAPLHAVLDRFGGYGLRLRAAHERIVSGETEWLTRPTIDSYHTVWFELHEDLLATLGRRRTDERHG